MRAHRFLNANINSMLNNHHHHHHNNNTWYMVHLVAYLVWPTDRPTGDCTDFYWHYCMRQQQQQHHNALLPWTVLCFIFWLPSSAHEIALDHDKIEKASSWCHINIGHYTLHSVYCCIFVFCFQLPVHSDFCWWYPWFDEVSDLLDICVYSSKICYLWICYLHHPPNMHVTLKYKQTRMVVSPDV